MRASFNCPGDSWEGDPRRIPRGILQGMLIRTPTPVRVEHTLENAVPGDSWKSDPLSYSSRNIAGHVDPLTRTSAGGTYASVCRPPRGRPYRLSLPRALPRAAASAAARRAMGTRNGDAET